MAAGNPWLSLVSSCIVPVSASIFTSPTHLCVAGVLSLPPFSLVRTLVIGFRAHLKPRMISSESLNSICKNYFQKDQIHRDWRLGPGSIIWGHRSTHCTIPVTGVSSRPGTWVRGTCLSFLSLRIWALWQDFPSVQSLLSWGLPYVLLVLFLTIGQRPKPEPCAQSPVSCHYAALVLTAGCWRISTVILPVDCHYLSPNACRLTGTLLESPAAYFHTSEAPSRLLFLSPSRTCLLGPGIIFLILDLGTWHLPLWPITSYSCFFQIAWFLIPAMTFAALQVRSDLNPCPALDLRIFLTGLLSWINVCV